MTDGSPAPAVVWGAPSVAFDQQRQSFPVVALVSLDGLRAAAVIAVLLFPAVYGNVRLLGGCVLWNALFISFGILLLFPQIGWYAGFSGVVHGLLMTGALLSLREPVSKLLVVLLVAKVGWELWSGGESVSTELIGAPVIYEAHLLGLMAGALAALPLQLLSMVREPRTSAP